MRRMSFALTTAQMRARTKTVTRRLGWKDVAPGHQLLAVAKARGVRTEDLDVLGVIEVVHVREEPLDRINAQDVVREGFPEMSPSEFVEMFCRSMRCEPNVMVRRIEFRHVEDDRG